MAAKTTGREDTIEDKRSIGEKKGSTRELKEGS
jgi:hypothetical protein